MSTIKGKAFVLSLATGPIAAVAIPIWCDPKNWLGLPKSLVLLVALLWAFLVRKITVPYLTSPLRHLPTLPVSQESFWSGHLTSLNKLPRGQTVCDWIDTVPNNGLLYLRGLFQTFPALIITTAEGLQEALTTKSYDFQKVTTDRIFLTMFLGRGLIVVEGAEHKFQRKHLQPAFSGKQINELIPVFWSKSKDLVEIIANKLDLPQGPGSQGAGRTGVVDLDHLASRVTLDIIGLACLGQDFNSLYNSDNKIVEQYGKILDPNNDNNRLILMLLTILLPLSIARRFPFSKQVRGAAEARYMLRILCRELMESKRKDIDSQHSKHTDIMSLLIRSGQFNNDQLVDQIMTFLAAGHETTSNALCWTLYLLAIHPDRQTRLREELRARFGRRCPTNMTDTDLDSLPFLNAVISEQLRLWPVVPVTGREASRDTSIGGQFIPKGTIIIMSPWGINRSKTFWGEDAAEFRPERWLSADGTELPFAGRGPFSNITFLHGPRSCIGQSFSRNELKCLLISMVMKFDIKMADPDEKIETGGLITIKPKNGLKLRLEELD